MIAILHSIAKNKDKAAYLTDFVVLLASFWYKVRPFRGRKDKQTFLV